MRTHGTFQEVYTAAREYYLGNAEDCCPTDPVVRRERGEWMLESQLTPAKDAVYECPLEAFDRFFSESYLDSDYTPCDRDIQEFLDLITTA